MSFPIKGVSEKIVDVLQKRIKNVKIVPEKAQKATSRVSLCIDTTKIKSKSVKNYLDYVTIEIIEGNYSCDCFITGKPKKSSLLMYWSTQKNANTAQIITLSNSQYVILDLQDELLQDSNVRDSICAKFIEDYICLLPFEVFVKKLTKF